MEHRIGGATHGDVECHGIHKGLARGYRAWQHALVAVFIVGQRILHHLSGCLFEQFDAVGMGGQYGAVARQRESDGLGQRVHRVGGEHARTAATARTGAMLQFCQLLVAHLGVGALHHGRNQVGILATPVPSLHRSARAEHRGDVQSHRCHQHAGCHLVAVGDTDHGVGLVGIHHILHRVGDDVARGQRVEHAVVAHGNTVVDGDGIKLSSIAAHLLNLFTNNLANFMQVRMTWHKLRERIDNGNNRLAKLLLFHTGGYP